MVSNCFRVLERGKRGRRDILETQFGAVKKVEMDLAWIQKKKKEDGKSEKLTKRNTDGASYPSAFPISIHPISKLLSLTHPTSSRSSEKSKEREGE